MNENQTTESKQVLSSNQKQSLKKYTALSLMFIVFAACIWLIFAPSEEKKAKKWSQQRFEPQSSGTQSADHNRWQESSLWRRTAKRKTDRENEVFTGFCDYPWKRKGRSGNRSVAVGKESEKSTNNEIKFLSFNVIRSIALFDSDISFCISGH